jgi:hypothetical protein
MVEVYQSDLDTLRLLLIGAGTLLLIWWFAQLAHERPDKPKSNVQSNVQTAAFCKLHQRAEHLCRDMHDQ